MLISSAERWAPCLRGWTCTLRSWPGVPPASRTVRVSVRWVLTLTPMSASMSALTCSVLLERRVNEETPACPRHQPQAHPRERSWSPCRL